MRLPVYIALIFLAACATPAMTAATSESITGTRWIAEAAGADERQRPRLEFQRDGRLAGYTGCNTLSGTWSVSAGAIQLGRLAMTKRACIGAGDALEKRFLAAVNERARIEVSGARLTAQGSGGEPMEFTRTPDA